MNKDLCEPEYLTKHKLVNPHKYYQFFITNCPFDLQKLIYVEWLTQKQFEMLHEAVTEKLRQFSLLLDGKSFTEAVDFMKKFNYHLILSMLKQEGWEEFKPEKDDTELLNDLLTNEKIQQRLEEIKKNHEEIIGYYNKQYGTNYQVDITEVMKQLLEEISDELGEDIESE